MEKIEDNIEEALLEISSKAQVHLLYVSKEYEQESQELSVLRKSFQIWSKEKLKPEEIIP